MSSLADFVTLAQVLLNGTLGNSLISRASTADLFRPVYTFVDGATSVGIPWEIVRSKIGNGRTIQEFVKGTRNATLYPFAHSSSSWRSVFSIQWT